MNLDLASLMRKILRKYPHCNAFKVRQFFKSRKFENYDDLIKAQEEVALDWDYTTEDAVNFGIDLIEKTIKD